MDATACDNINYRHRRIIAIMTNQRKSNKAPLWIMGILALLTAAIAVYGSQS